MIWYDRRDRWLVGGASRLGLGLGIRGIVEECVIWCRNGLLSDVVLVGFELV